MGVISRRKLLKAGALTAGGALAWQAAPAWAKSAPAAASISVVPTMAQFGYGDVQLLDGPMREQFDRNHNFFLAMDEDKLLKPFRERAGLPAPGEDMGGWYDNSNDFHLPNNFHGFIPGHSFGQYVSGLARAYAATGSLPTKEKVHRLVRGYAATVSEKFYMDYHLPAYTYDKTSCGLIDAHQFAGDPDAMTVLGKATDAVLPFLPEKALSRPEQRARPHKDEAYTWDETYTLPENFFLAYRRSGNARYRKLGVRFLEDDTYFNPLAAGQNVLPGKHAYSHMNALSSAMQAYLVTGSEKHLRAAKNAFEMIRTTQSFATGGWGPNESFRKPGSGDLGASLTETHASFETPCGAYGHFKITRYLLRVTRDSRYGDSMEQVLYNTILGAKPLQPDGSSFYYSDYNEVAHKGYHRDKWPCCSGTFPQITADYGISSYFHDAQGVYVNLYVPSRVTWRQNGARCSLTQLTSYPASNQTRMEITADRAEKFAVRLRIPAWAGAKTSVSVNGKRLQMDLTPGQFATLVRTWKSGDVVELELDMPTHLEAVDAQHQNLVALMHGPVALFAVGDVPAQLTRAQLLSAGPVSKGSADWQFKSNTGAVQLKQFANIRDEQYRLYQNVIA
ncbi:MAG: beta-L-arabinofuranosidase domain-containing protein [Acidobacteriaceae bacterium]